MSKLRLGVVGCGIMGLKHAQVVIDGQVPDMELTAVCDGFQQRLDEIKEKNPTVATFDNPTKLYESGLCDVVMIATPHYSHPDLAIEAFKNGLHVIIEKPAGVYTKHVKEMNEAAKKSGKMFGIMYNQRTNPVYQKLREIVLSGELGHIKRITWIITDWYRPQAYHSSSPWRSTWKGEGGGALINQNPHQIDLWQWMFGMPDKIYAQAGFGKYYDIEVEDDVMAFFEYANGTTGQYITSTGEAPGTNRLEIACDMGKIVIENNEMTFYKNAISEREFNKINTELFAIPEYEKINIPVDFTVGAQHTGILNDFASAVLNGTELLAKGEDGLNALTIINAIEMSAWTGEMVDVNNFDDDRYYNLLQEKIKAAEAK